MRPTWIRRKLATRILVHTTADDSIEGVLVLVAKDGLLLDDAAVLSERRTPLSGKVFIPKVQIRMIQELPPRATSVRETP